MVMLVEQWLCLLNAKLLNPYDLEQTTFMSLNVKVNYKKVHCSDIYWIIST